MNEIEQHVLEMIGEDPDSPDVFTEDSEAFKLIRGSVNDAVQEISLIMGAVVRHYKIPIRASANFYRLNFTNDIIAWVKSVWLYGTKRKLAQTGITALAMENPRWLYNVSTPTSYFMIGENILGIHPRPSSAAGLIELKAAVVPSPYTEAIDRVKLRNQFKWGAVQYAVGEYYASRGDAKRAIKFHKRYLTIVGLDETYPQTADRQWGLSSTKTLTGGIEKVNI